MEWPDLVGIQSLLDDIRASVEKFERTQNELARVDALEKSLKLSRALENPHDVVFKLFLSTTKLMALKIAHDLGLFHIVTKSDAPITLNELSDQTKGDLLLIERILRILVSMGFAEESNGKYSPNLLTYEMTNKKSFGVIDTLFVDLAPAVLKTPEFLRKTDYQNPENLLAGPIQYTYNTPMTTFEWLAKDVAVLERFHQYVEAVRTDRPFWVEWYPVQERILTGYVGQKDDPLIVDIAAGSGRDMLAFKQKFPNVEGRIILQDLPTVFNDVHYHDLGLEKIEYDIFTSQPVHGARVYFLKFTLHEFSDDKCKAILNNITEVMKKGYSKILIEEFIFEKESHSGSFYPMIDMILMVFGPGVVRTQSKWETILRSVGLTVSGVWHPNAEGPSIIEAEL